MRDCYDYTKIGFYTIFGPPLFLFCLPFVLVAILFIMMFYAVGRAAVWVGGKLGVAIDWIESMTAHKNSPPTEDDGP